MAGSAGLAARVCAAAYVALGLIMLPQVRETLGLPRTLVSFEADFLINVAALCLFSVLHTAELHGLVAAIVFLFITVAATTAAEIASLSTGWPFGSYRFIAGRLGPFMPGLRVELPVAVPFCWFSMALPCAGAASALLHSPTAREAPLVSSLRRRIVQAAAWALLASALLAATNCVNDPVLSSPGGHWKWHFRALHHMPPELHAPTWQWSPLNSGATFHGVPVRNFVAWLLVALPCFLVAAAAGVSPAPPLRATLLPLFLYTSTGFFYAAHPSHTVEVRVTAVLAILLPALIAWLRAALSAADSEAAPAPAPVAKSHGD